MADTKSDYSEASENYTTQIIEKSEEQRRNFNRSKAREERYNDVWKEHPVNINEVVQEYAPNTSGKAHGVKYIFDGDQHVVIADMASGYLRIYDSETGMYLDHNRKPSRDKKTTHFKIKRREEM